MKNEHQLGFGIDGDGVRQVPVVPQAYTRRDDPATSHEAAASLTPKALTASQTAVLRLLAYKTRPMADEEWMAHYAAGDAPFALPSQSPSGLRSRRAALVERGFVAADGETLIRNRRHTTWTVTLAGREELGRIARAANA